MIGLVDIAQRAPASATVDMWQADGTRTTGQRMLLGAMPLTKSLHHGSFGLPLPLSRGRRLHAALPRSTCDLIASTR